MIKRVNFNYCSNFLNIASKKFFKNISNGHLVSVDGGETARYFYDYEMRRRKVVYTDRTILFFYDLEGKLISELDLSSNKWKDYIYIDLEPIGRIDQRQPWVKIGDSYLKADKTGGKVHLDWSLYGGPENFRIYYTINDFAFTNPSVLQETPNKTYDHNVLNDGNNYAYRIYKNVPTEGLFFYHTDHLMTPLQMTDENQNIVWQAEYYPFGRIYSQSGDIENNLRFPGQYSEPNMNLYYNWHRYYFPSLGIYNITDKKMRENEYKLYYYSNQNPIIKYDYCGLYTIDKSCSLPPFNYYDINKALKDIEGKINTGCVKSQKLRNKLNKILVKIRIKCDKCYSKCGCTFPILTKIIKLGIKSLDPASCGPLATTILHEMVHQAGYFTEDVPRACEASCYNYNPLRFNPENCK